MKRSIRTLALTLAVTILMGMLTSCGSSTPAAEPSATPSSTPVAETTGEKAVTITLSAPLEGFNPLGTTNTNTGAILDVLFDRLFDVNTDGTYEPRLIDSWQWNDAQDVLTIHIREDAKWHDGEPVTSADVVYTYQLASNPDAGWLDDEGSEAFKGTDENGFELSENSIEVIAIDEHTVQFNLKKPTDEGMFFLVTTRSSYILPEHLLSGIPDTEVAAADFWQNPVGSGPFKLDSFIDGERYEFVANDDYPLGRPDIDRLIVRVMDSSSITAGLLNGEVDVGVVADADLDLLAEQDFLTVSSTPSFSYQSLVINLSDPLFQDERVRVAFNAAINKQAIVDTLYGGRGVTTETMYPANHPYHNDNISEDTYDPARAKQLLDEAGWDYNTVIEFQTSTGIREQIAALIQQDLAAIGVQTSIVTYDFATVLQNMRDEAFQLLIMGSASSVDPLAGTNSLTYWSHTKDPELLELIEKATAGLNFEERKTYYDQIQELIVERQPMVYLVVANSTYVYNNRVSNIPFDKTDFGINKQAYKWIVK